MLLKTLLICTQISGSTSLQVLHLYRYYISGFGPELLEASQSIPPLGYRCCDLEQSMLKAVTKSYFWQVNNRIF